MRSAALPPRLLERVVAQRGGLRKLWNLDDAYDPNAPVEARVLAARRLLVEGRTDSKLVALKILAQHREEPPFDDIYQEPLATLMEELVEGWMRQVPFDDYSACISTYAACLLADATKTKRVVDKMRSMHTDSDLPCGALDDYIVRIGAPENFEMIDVAAARQAVQRSMYALVPHKIVDELDDLDRAVDWWLDCAGLDQLVSIMKKSRQPAEKRVLLEALKRCDYIKQPVANLTSIVHGKPGYRLIARLFPESPKLFQQWLDVGHPNPLTRKQVKNLLEGVNGELDDIARWTQPQTA